MAPIGRPTRRTRALRIALGAAALSAMLGTGIWWYGPWNAELRYSHTDLVTLRRIVEASPGDYHAWRQLGLRLAADGDPLAEAPLRHALSLQPTDAHVATSLGELLIATDRVPDAFQVLKSAVGTSPRFALAHAALGKLYMKKGSYLHATEELEAATALDASLSDAWHYLAICYLQTQQAGKAEHAINRALHLDPDDARYLALKGSIEVAVGNVDDGLRHARMAARQAPKDPHILATLADMLLANHRSEDDLAEASTVIDKFAAVEPDNPLVLYQRGELERLRGHWSSAADQLERALALAPHKLEIYFALSQTYRRMGRNADADRMLAIYRKRQDLDRQIAAAEMALAERPTDVRAYVRVVDLKIQSEDIAGAIASARAGLALEPKYKPLLLRMERLESLASAAPTGP